MNERLYSVAVEELRVMRVGTEQVVAHDAAGLGLEPAVDSRTEEADLRLVDDPVRDQTPHGSLEDVLAGLQTTNLVLGRNRRRILDDLVVEERHPNFERVRHRTAVEVMDHVVDEGELPVQVERCRDGLVRETVEARAD